MKVRSLLFGVCILISALTVLFIRWPGISNSASTMPGGTNPKKAIIRLYTHDRRNFPDILEISAEKALRDYHAGNAVFVDIRPFQERAVSILPGALTEDEFMDAAGRYGDRIVVAYCTIGYRSGLFSKKLEGMDIPVFNLKGGILAWAHAGGKLYDAGGETNRLHVYGPKWNHPPEGYIAVW